MDEYYVICKITYDKKSGKAKLAALSRRESYEMTWYSDIAHWGKEVFDCGGPRDTSIELCQDCAKKLAGIY